MDATRRLARDVRHIHSRGRIPALLLLRSAIALLVLVALAAGAVASDPQVIADQGPTVAATASGAKRPAHSPATTAPTRRKRSVFVCDDAGTPVYADRPCGPDLVRRVISVDHAAAGQTATTVPRTPQASTRPRIRDFGAGAADEKAAERCGTLRRQLDDLDDRMRTGYSSREAAQLWDRRRNIKGALRQLGC
jgi:hypothetical protein